MRRAKVALVGLGGWGGTESLPAIASTESLELISWFDADPDTVARYRGEVPVPPAGSFGELLENSEVEGLILVVPNHVHPALAIQAAGRGKHVWVEKPIANSLAETDAMIQACEDAGVILQVGHSLRRTDGMRRIKRLIEGDRIGELAAIEAHQSHRGGWTLTPQMWRWYNDKCPGGPLNLLGVHQIDNMHYLVGPSDEVVAMTAKRCLDCEIDEITQVVIRSKSGILGQIGNTYITPAKTFIAVYGTTGWLEFDFVQNRLTYFNMDGRPEDIPVKSMSLIGDELHEFGECILTGKRPETGGAEARAVVAVMEAAVESARTGKAVKI